MRKVFSSNTVSGIFTVSQGKQFACKIAVSVTCNSPVNQSNTKLIMHVLSYMYPGDTFETFQLQREVFKLSSFGTFTVCTLP